MSEPKIDWIKNDPEKHRYFNDGDVFLIAIPQASSNGVERWDFDVVEMDCDGEGASMWFRNKSEVYDSWSWDDVEYFKVLEGNEPTADIGEDQEAFT